VDWLGHGLGEEIGGVIVVMVGWSVGVVWMGMGMGMGK